MAEIFWAAPYTPPTPPIPVWQGFTHTWTGWDGREWPLSDPEKGVALLKDGVTGMHMPEFDQPLDEYASVDGARYRGTRARVRNPEWLIGIYGDTTAAWRKLDVEFWKSMHPDKPGVWTVTDSAGKSRSLRCRFRSTSEHQYGVDPAEVGWSLYTVTLLAEGSYWEGEEISSPTWTAADPVDFIDSEELGPPYHPGNALTTGDAELTNPGDVDAWLTWQIEAVEAVTSVDIDAAAGKLGYGAMSQGDVLVISTDPTRPMAELNGEDVSGTIDPWDPRPIPAGETSPLGIDMVGGGAIRATFTPRHFRAI